MVNRLDLCDCKTIIFDCDGVILNSNHIKTTAFRSICEPYGNQETEDFLRFHQSNGGISREVKFSYFLEKIIKFRGDVASEHKKMMSEYSSIVSKGMLTCEVNEYIYDLKLVTPEAKWMVLSGSNEIELKHVFGQRDLGRLFNLGIYGSPDSKKTHMRRFIETDFVERPAMFIGDSMYDYEVALEFDLQFVFLTQWTEVSDWMSREGQQGFSSIGRLSDLM